MLPRFLAELKTENYHVVAMVPGGVTTPTRPAPAGWTSETERTVSHIRPNAQPASAPDADGASAGATRDVKPAPLLGHGAATTPACDGPRRRGGSPCAG